MLYTVHHFHHFCFVTASLLSVIQNIRSWRLIYHRNSQLCRRINHFVNIVNEHLISISSDSTWRQHLSFLNPRKHTVSEDTVNRLYMVWMLPVWCLSISFISPYVFLTLLSCFLSPLRSVWSVTSREVYWWLMGDTVNRWSAQRRYIIYF